MHRFFSRSKKRFSQNFLNSPGVVKKICGWAGTDNAVVLEIGAGKGILTRELARRAATVYAIELDVRLCEKLKGIAAPNIHIINADFLTLDLTRFRPDVVMGNLPYAITAKIIDTLARQKSLFRRAILTVQREYGNKILAAAGDPEYDPASIFVQYHFRPQKCFIIPPKYFTPRPKVSSMVVRLETREEPACVTDEAGLFDLIRGVFRYRRKRLKNALARSLDQPVPALPASLLDKRPAEVTVDEYKLIHAAYGNA